MKNKKGKFFDEEHLMGNAFSFFAASAATTSDFLTWFFLIMIVHPEIQQKVRKEIDEVIGSARPSLTHRDSMPFTEAVVQEVHRFSSSLPSGLPHAVAEDVWLEGYFLPKGTQVVLYASEVHMNPEYFPEPGAFIPERHIDENGKFFRDERVMSFGLGKRSCPGEPIANMEIFLYVTCFMQQFEVQAPAGKKYGLGGVPDLLGRVPADSPIHIVFKRR